MNRDRQTDGMITIKSMLANFMVLAMVLGLCMSGLSGRALAADWAANFGSKLGGPGSIYTQATATDAAGNIYLAGHFGGVSATIGNVTLTSIGTQDAFVAKLDASGTVLWAKNFGGNGAYTQGNGIAVDGSGNVYLGGNFNGDLTTPALTKIGSQDAYAIKLDSSGSVTWAKNFGGYGAGASCSGIAVDGFGNVYLGGYLGNASLTTPALTKIGTYDAFVIKLDSSGSVTWARNFGGNGAYVQGNSIAVDGSGNVYLGGYFNGASLTSPVLTKIGNSDAFALKLDSFGVVTWAKNFGGYGAYANGRSIAVDDSGNVYLGGSFDGSSLYTPSLAKIGSTDAFAIKLDSGGAVTWAKNFGGWGAYASGNGIAVDGSGNVYLGGSFSSADLTTPSLRKIGSTDAFAIKLDSSGAVTWAKNFGGSGAGANGNGIAVDGFGNVYLGGDLGGGNLTTPALTKIGSQDAFAIKLDSSGAVTWGKNFASSSPNVSGSAIARDASGNTYLAGTFDAASLTIGNVTLTRIGSNDAFVAKLDASGTVLWAKNFGGSGVSTYGYGIAVDGFGNVYLGGHFYNGDLTTPALTKIGITDAYAIKLNSSGSVTWARNFGGSGAYASGNGIAVDGSGNVYLGGNLGYGNLTTPALKVIGSQDAYAIKLDSSGSITWARNFGGIWAYMNGRSIAVDGSGNMFLGGDWSNGNLTSPDLKMIGNGNAFAIKLDSGGTVTWAKNYGGSGDAYGGSIAVDHSGNVYLGGSFNGSSLYSPSLAKIGSSDAFAIKLDSSGAVTWAKNFGGSGARASVSGIAVDGSGNVYMGGSLYSADFTTPSLRKIGSQDAFAIKLDSGGAVTWAKNFGGSGTYAYGNGIAVDGSGNIYLGGFFSGASLTTPALTKIGIQDAFIIASATPPSALNITTTSFPWASPNIAYSIRIMAAGGITPYTFSMAYGNLPTGLSFDTATGIISGTPSGKGSYTFAIGVTDSVAVYSEKEYTLDVVDPLLIPTVSISAGQQGAAYNASLTASGGKPAYIFSLIGGTLPNGVSLLSDGVVTGMPREAGNFTFTVRVTDSTARTYDKQFSLTISAAPVLSLVTTSLPAGYIGSYYTATVVAAGGVSPLTFSVAQALPAGLSYNTWTGEIYGIPTAAGLTNLTFNVSDNSYPTAQTTGRTMPLRIWSVLAISTATIPDGTQKASYSATLSGSGGAPPRSWSIASGALPQGITLDPVSGVLSGTPAVCGTFPFTVRMTDSASPPTYLDKLFTLNLTCSNDYIITGNAGIAGATVAYSGPASGAVTADAGGNFSIGPLPGGSYTVTPAKSPYIFTPASQTLDVTRDVQLAAFTAAADSAPPTVTGFTLPATAISSTVAVVTFTATDNSGAVSYLLTEEATQPSATDTGWSSTAPTTYTFNGVHNDTPTARTLYAWAKDSAGNISAPLSAPVTITVLTRPGTWQNMAPIAGSVLSIAIDPTDSRVIYVGTNPNGMFKTTDGGISWAAINNGMKDIYGIGSEANTLLIDPNNTQTIYAGTSMGVFKSTDRGASWVWTWTIAWSSVSVNSMVFEPGNSQTLYAAGSRSYYSHGVSVSDRGVYKSADGGVIWTPVNSGLPPTDNVHALLIDPHNSQVMYVATWQNGVYKTVDGGSSWVPVNNGLSQLMILTLALDPHDGQTVYAAGNNGTLFKTANGGASWTMVIGGAVQGTGISANAIAVSPENSQIVYIGTNTGSNARVAVSADGGNSWRWDSAGLTGTWFNTIAITPGTGTVLDPSVYAGTDTGIYRAVSYTPPTVTSFSLPATTVGYTTQITTFTATDNLGVTGYLLTESAASPSLTDSGWSVAVPTTYTFGTTGSQTLYAWVRDAAGSISTSAAAGTTVVLPENGACGSSSGVAQIAAPTANLCVTGTATPVTGSGPWQWSCAGLYGGATVTCGAPLQSYTVTLNAANGSISGPTTVNYGDRPTYTITPNTGYHLTDVTVNGTSVGAVTSYTFATGITATSAITATFTINSYPVTVSLSGGGSLSSSTAGLTCSGSTCSGTFTHGTVLTLTPVPNAGNILTGWGGACTGTGSCTVTVTDTTNISAAFSSVKTLTVTLAGTGSGTVTGNPPGLSCHAGTCSTLYLTGEQVTLLTTPSIGSLFSGWSGACSGGSCRVTMDADRSATATFTSPLPARIGQTPYNTLQLAYDNAPSAGGVIMLKEGVLTGPFTANAGKSVTIAGGYNPAFNGAGSDTVIAGSIVVKSGTVIFDEVRVR